MKKIPFAVTTVVFSLCLAFSLSNCGDDGSSSGDDTTAPEFIDSYPVTTNIEQTTIDVLININENGKVYFVILTDGAGAPSSVQVKAGQDSNSNEVAADKKGEVDLTANTDATVNITGLTAGTAYDIYLVAEDTIPNLMTSPIKVDVITAYSCVATSVYLRGMTDNGGDWDPGIQMTLSANNTWTVTLTLNDITDAFKFYINGDTYKSNDGTYQDSDLSTWWDTSGTNNTQVDFSVTGTGDYIFTYRDTDDHFMIKSVALPFKHNIGSVYLRGLTSNGGDWDPGTQMTLTADNTWTVTKTFATFPDDFQFYINGNTWRTNGGTYDDDDLSTWWSTGGAGNTSINLTTGTGDYIFIYRDTDHNFLVKKSVSLPYQYYAHSVYLRGLTSNGGDWDPGIQMNLTSDYTWTVSVSLNTLPDQFKFYINGVVYRSNVGTYLDANLGQWWTTTVPAGNASVNVTTGNYTFTYRDSDHNYKVDN